MTDEKLTFTTESLLARIAELETGLPRTADGVAIKPSMAVWIIPLAGENKGKATPAVVDFIGSDCINGHPERIHVFVDVSPEYGGYTPEYLTFASRDRCEQYAKTIKWDAPPPTPASEVNNE